MTHFNCNLRKKVLLLLANFLCFFLFSSTSWAYIPQLSLIAKRTTRHHGTGSYKIEQKVNFYHNATTQSFKEIWTVTTGGNMSLQVKGMGPNKNKVFYSAIYKEGVRYKLTAPQKLSQDELESGWFNSYFHYRQPQNILKHMYTHQMIPRSALEKPPIPSKENNFQRPPQKYVKLSRVGGGVSYLVGQPSSRSHFKPSLWIEQDTFLIQKIRLPNNAKISAKSYSSYKKGLWLPRNVSVSWESHRAQIKLLKVRTVSSSVAQKSLSLNRLKKQKITQANFEDSVVANFYSIFR